MSEISIIWLKALLIEMASCPLMYVCTVFNVHIKIIVVRNVKGVLRLVLFLIVGLTQGVVWILPMYLAAISGLSPNQSGSVRLAFIIWVSVLHVLSVSPAFWYHLKRLKQLEEPGPSNPWNK